MSLKTTAPFGVRQVTPAKPTPALGSTLDSLETWRSKACVEPKNKHETQEQGHWQAALPVPDVWGSILRHQPQAAPRPQTVVRRDVSHQPQRQGPSTKTEDDRRQL